VFVLLITSDKTRIESGKYSFKSSVGFRIAKNAFIKTCVLQIGVHLYISTAELTLLC